MSQSLFSMLLLTAIASTSISPAWGSTEELERAAFQIIPFFNEGPYVSIEKRKAYMKALEAYWQSFRSRTPRLSPAETEWLTGELSSEGERLTSAINSREFAIYSLNQNIDECITSLHKISDVLDEQKQSELEMFHWLGMVTCYSNVPDMMSRLQQAGLSNGRSDGPFYAAGSSLIMSTIVQKVIPSAMADTMGWKLSNP